MIVPRHEGFQKVDAIAAVTTRYYYDGQRVVLQTVVSGLTETDSRTFLYGSYIDEVLLMTALDASPQTDYYYAHDHLYSPVALFLSNGTLAERYEYDAYGKTRIRSSNYLPQTSSQYGNSYTFTGRELDSLNNNSLQIMYYRARSYDPQSGRFMQRDPAEYNDSMNIYEYVISRPTMLKDPYGLFWKLSGECPFMVGGIKVRCAKLAGEVIDENSGWMSPDTLHQYLLSLGLDVVGMPLGGTATKVGWGIAIGWTFANNCCIPEMKVEGKKCLGKNGKGVI
jgi:RHS repeat-associated protein